MEAGTDSAVFLEIFGTNANTPKLNLNNTTSLDKKANLFEKSKTDVFEVEAVNVGKVNEVIIAHSLYYSDGKQLFVMRFYVNVQRTHQIETMTSHYVIWRHMNLLDVI